jgi:muramoyltetrapeptide carboxypeptidase
MAELELGLERIQSAGFELEVHPHTKKSHWFFAGTDEERAHAFYEFAMRGDLPVLWCARGGYGATRILPILERLVRERGKPPRDKLLIGYSDATVLHEFTRKSWGWRTLHGPMPGLRRFCRLKESHLKETFALARAWDHPVEFKGLRFAHPSPGTIRAPLVGGNLSLWAFMVGTDYAADARGKIVFFEEVDEALYRIDRMVQQILNSGALEGARAIVLGNFENCHDVVAQALKQVPQSGSRDRVIDKPKPSELGPIRRKLNEPKVTLEIFGQIASHYGIPLAYGLPVGHGRDQAPLPLGGEYELTPGGVLSRL